MPVHQVAAVIPPVPATGVRRAAALDRGDAEPNADMWATSDESREQIVGLYHRVWVHSDATI
jgi:hypothetical protein